MPTWNTGAPASSVVDLKFATLGIGGGMAMNIKPIITAAVVATSLMSGAASAAEPLQIYATTVGEFLKRNTQESNWFWLGVNQALMASQKGWCIPAGGLDLAVDLLKSRVKLYVSKNPEHEETNGGFVGRNAMYAYQDEFPCAVSK